MRPRLLAGSALTALLAVVLVLATLVGCSRGFETPEELFAEGCRLTNEGRHSAFFDLYSTEQRQDFIRQVDGMREAVKKNPGLKQLVDRWQVTEEEFIRLPYPELYQRAHKGTEGALLGARIIDRSVDPVNGKDVSIIFETTAGQRFRWVMRHEEKRGWTFQQQSPVKME